MPYKKLSNNQVIKTARDAWPVILNKIKNKADNKIKSYTPLKISRITEPYICLPSYGCKHHLRGGCVMCNYRARQVTKKKGNLHKLKKQAKEGVERLKTLNEINNDLPYYFYGIGTGGSFFDPTEIPKSVRIFIYNEIMRHTPRNKMRILGVESRLEFINEDIINEARTMLGKNSVIQIGYGLESTNELIREACINKRLPGNWQEKIKLMKRKKIIIYAHVIVKPPFLTENEAIYDVVESTQKILQTKLAYYVVIMVMRSFPNTAINRLEKLNKYRLPNIWSIIKIIQKLGPEVCKKIILNGLAWTKEDRSTRERPGFVRGCGECSPILMPQLFAFKMPTTEQWNKLIDSANSLNCQCKRMYVAEHDSELFNNFNQRIVYGLGHLYKSVAKKNMIICE